MRMLKGNSDFRTIRDGGYYYVDKSRFIADVIRANDMVVLITRPRRFGKTLNLSMLDYFFQSYQDHSGLFADLAIAEDAEAMAHLGKYPTVFLSFKDIDCRSWHDCQIKIKEMFAFLFLQHKALILQAEPTHLERITVNAILDGKAPITTLENALRLLTQLLERAAGAKVILLIDEYDIPINAGQSHQHFEEIVDFTRNLMKAGLKDNLSLQRGVLTGIMRVAKESIFSALNNIEAYTVLSEPFSQHFGFLEDEVQKVVADFQLPVAMDEVRRWYNGYGVGHQRLYNPWSIMTMASLNGKLACHWINTSSNQLIKDLLTWDRSLADGDLARLLRGWSIERPISETFSLRDLRPEDVWSLLLFSGYLTFTEGEHKDSAIYALRIPNFEVRAFFEETVKRWVELPGRWDGMTYALAHDDIDALELHLKAYIKSSLSCFDLAGQGRNGAKSTRQVAPESLYHVFFLGMLLHQQDHYEISSNRESGYGRYDIMLVPKQSNLSGYVFEFKQTTRANLNAAAQAAVQQIEDREYLTPLREAKTQRFWMIGVAFCGKQLSMARKLFDKARDEQSMNQTRDVPAVVDLSGTYFQDQLVLLKRLYSEGSISEAVYQTELTRLQHK